MANRKTENDVLIASPSLTAKAADAFQISLPIQVESKPPNLTDEQRQHRENLEAFYQNIRQETSQILLIAQLQNPEQNWGRLQEVPTPELARAREAYERRPVKFAPLPHADLWGRYQQQADDEVQSRQQQGAKPVKVSAKPSAYKPWPLERRQRLAARKLRGRALKRSTFPQFWIPWMQEQLMKDPWRFGVCPLPGEQSCIIPDPSRILSRAKAIAHEVKCRQKELQPEPLRMPLRIEPERELQTESNQIEFRS